MIHALRRFAAALSVTLTSLGAALAQPATGQAQPIAPRIEWNEIAWSGGALDVALVRPSAGTVGPHPVVFALPWGGGTADLVETFVRSYWLTEPSARGYYVVSPEVRGSTLAHTAAEIIPAIFAWMDQELDYDEGRVALVGASNGGSGAFFAALSQPQRFHALMALPGQYGGDATDLAVLAGKPIYFLVGQRDEAWGQMTDRTRAALESQGIASALWVAPGQGHVLRLDPRGLLDWIDRSLNR